MSKSKSKPIVVVSGVALAAVLLGVVSYTATRPASPGAAGSSSVAEVSADPSAGVYAELEAYAATPPTSSPSAAPTRPSCSSSTPTSSAATAGSSPGTPSRSW